MKCRKSLGFLRSFRTLRDRSCRPLTAVTGVRIPYGTPRFFNGLSAASGNLGQAIRQICGIHGAEPGRPEGAKPATSTRATPSASFLVG